MYSTVLRELSMSAFVLYWIAVLGTQNVLKYLLIVWIGMNEINFIHYQPDICCYTEPLAIFKAGWILSSVFFFKMLFQDNVIFDLLLRKVRQSYKTIKTFHYFPGERPCKYVSLVKVQLSTKTKNLLYC